MLGGLDLSHLPAFPILNPSVPRVEYPCSDPVYPVTSSALAVVAGGWRAFGSS
ncbi:uncharacterized protein K452DRAFT_151558 [Aplosporella prunicola CBS 121167]|uniref:Uncharacterized protein n=1 Tax=Aplosporella prunicola CBS 121167 TaxID=1176127 RepID=A0A6A6BIS1_9PEZI|nr:uncharacterized protein K452DRAFT_151558 [Aplosporella prunicola CBS 121167]KAF2144019.1 hypothetical protein K452DRAFT_151558 [Aplosporella prunicola CBS 121167]